MDFAIAPEDYAAAEGAGEIQLVVHSHPNISPKPSQADLIGCEESGLPWLIINWPIGTTYQFEPSGYEAPLIGREYLWGVTDCFTLIRDYYKQKFGITINDRPRDARFWHKGESLYVDNYESEGFVRIKDLKDIREHDVLLMQARSRVPNHGAIYIGNEMILQHFEGRLSSRDPYGGLYQKITTHILRHKDLM
jgi:cell wall-associated NlpC family hydrolase